MTGKTNRNRFIFVTLGILILGGLALALVKAQALPQGVRPIIWDKENCAECRMSISDPAFACQLQTRQGQVLDFDDPGCLMAYLARTRPEVHQVFFHALHGEQWLSREQATFVPASPSPMAYDLGAVAGPAPGGLTFAAALQRTQTIPKHPGGQS